MYILYDDRSQIFETEQEAKDFLLDELTQWDSDFFSETLNDNFFAFDIFRLLVNGESKEDICNICDNVVYDMAVKEIENNFNQYFDEIIEDEEE